jgi:hypothetical protein
MHPCMTLLRATLVSIQLHRIPRPPFSFYRKYKIYNYVFWLVSSGTNFILYFVHIHPLVIQLNHVGSPTDVPTNLATPVCVIFMQRTHNLPRFAWVSSCACDWVGISVWGIPSYLNTMGIFFYCRFLLP